MFDKPLKKEIRGQKIELKIQRVITKDEKSRMIHLFLLVFSLRYFYETSEILSSYIVG